MGTIAQVSAELQAYLGAEADRLGRSSGFIQRERKLSGRQFAQSLIFGWLGNAQASLSELSQSASNLGVDISRQGLAGRFDAKAATFMQSLLEAATSYVWEGSCCNSRLLSQFESLYLYDSTVITLPDALAPLWQGNGTQSGAQAALKVSVRCEMRRGHFHVELQAGRAHDASSALLALPVEADALRLADLGYFVLADFERLAAAGAYWLSRYRVAVGVAWPDGTPFELVAFLQQHPQASLDCAILLGQKHQLPCRLIAQRAPATVVAQRHAALREWSQRTGRALSAERLALADWSIWVTNIPAARLSATQLATLTTYRWQIELLFKLWKSELTLDSWRSANPWRILCEIYAKLIAALLLHTFAVLANGHDPQRSLTRMSRSIRHFAWRLAASLADPPRFHETLLDLLACLANGCRTSKSRLQPRSFQRLDAAFLLS